APLPDSLFLISLRGSRHQPKPGRSSVGWARRSGEMRRVNWAWLGLITLAGCAGKDHSLGEGKTPSEHNGVTAAEGGTPEGVGGTPGSGGSSEPGDPETGG